MSKMVTNYIKVFMPTITLLKNRPGCQNFRDIGGIGSELQGYVKTICEYGIMGQTAFGTVDTDFYPDMCVNRAQFLTLFSRLLYGPKYNLKKTEDDTYYYKYHAQALFDAGVVKKIDPAELFNPELRVRAWTMMMRSTELAQRADFVNPITTGTGN